MNGGLQQFVHLIRKAVDCKNFGGIFMTPDICPNYLYYFFQTSAVAEDVTPVTAYDKNGLKTVIYFSSNRPRPDVLVMVLSTLSTNTKPVKNFMFQAAVPKVRRGCLFFNLVIIVAVISIVLYLTSKGKQALLFCNPFHPAPDSRVWRCWTVLSACAQLRVRHRNLFH